MLARGLPRSSSAARAGAIERQTPAGAIERGPGARCLRGPAGYTREQLAADTGLPAEVLVLLETGRQRARPWIVYRLLKSPVMSRLPDHARARGLRLERGDLSVGAALAFYRHAVHIPRQLRTELRQYFAPITRKHYIAPSTIEAARSSRVAGALLGKADLDSLIGTLRDLPTNQLDLVCAAVGLHR